MSAMLRHHAAPRVRAIAADADARVRLICFPYAGAGPSIFNCWSERLIEGVALMGVEYPGGRGGWAKRR